LSIGFADRINVAEIAKQKYARTLVSKLTPHPSNPRKGDVAAIEASIIANGFYGAVVAQRSTGYVLAGNHRLEAAIAQGLASVPVIWLECDDDEALRVLLADNRTNDLAGYDEAALAKLLDGMDALEGTGYDQAAVDALVASVEVIPPGLTDEDVVPEAPVVPITKPGDLWLLGKHRLLCGDSTVATDVDKLLGDAKPHLMVTDPPYGVEYEPDWRNDAVQAGHGKGAPGGRAIGKVNNDDRADWTEAWALFPGDVAYVWHASLHAGVVANSLAASGLMIRSQIIWAKSHLAISRCDYHWQHEPCWYAVKKNRTGHWSSDRKQTTLWQIDKPQKSETGHSTQKPIECMRRPMENNSVAGDAVYDPFCGSGTTIIAAETTGRVCYAMELDPKYCDVIVNRWQAFTGKLATLSP
jgi:DNA modification methylase